MLKESVEKALSVGIPVFAAAENDNIDEADDPRNAPCSFVLNPK
jgi:hypothetical protein